MAGAGSGEEPAPVGMPIFTIVDGVLTAVELNGATEVTIPDGVTEIGADVFCRETNLVSVVIPEGVTGIGEGAFYYCPNLVSVSLPGTLKRIEDRAFGWCFSLDPVSLPTGLEVLGGYAFDCSGLTTSWDWLPKRPSD